MFWSLVVVALVAPVVLVLIVVVTASVVAAAVTPGSVALTSVAVVGITATVVLLELPVSSSELEAILVTVDDTTALVVVAAVSELDMIVWLNKLNRLGFPLPTAGTLPFSVPDPVVPAVVLVCEVEVEEDEAAA